MIPAIPAYEQGPIRPPNEANSLLLRITRNCPWNRCLFCPVYKGKKFSRRSFAEIAADIEAMADAAARVKDISLAAGFGGKVNRDTLALVQVQFPELLGMAFWQYNGGEKVFLQDGDSLLLPVDQLIEILTLLKKKFPTITRITTYARSKTLVRRTTDDLNRLREAGLNRIHVGLESGSDRVLTLMKKGVNASGHVEAGQKVKEAGIALSEYILLGLGGKELWREHALETAQVVNSINPDFIRFRTLAVYRSAPLEALVSEGKFKPLTDDELAEEQLLFLENLSDFESEVYSDHILNLLEEVRGKLPEDGPRLQQTVKDYLSLDSQKRELFRLGRRAGYFRALSDLEKGELYPAVKKTYDRLQAEGRSIETFIEELRRRYI